MCESKEHRNINIYLHLPCLYLFVLLAIAAFEFFVDSEVNLLLVKCEDLIQNQSFGKSIFLKDSKSYNKTLVNHFYMRHEEQVSVILKINISILHFRAHEDQIEKLLSLV